MAFTAHSNSVPTVTPTMSAPLHEKDADSTLPSPQRDWRSMTRTIAHYERIEQIGEGTYGQVYRARCIDTDQIVALKKIRVHHGDYWGLPPTILREIKILKRLRHPNLVQMVEVVSSKGVEHLDEDDLPEEKHRVSKNDKVGDAREGYKGNLFLVLEYVSHDLTGLMDVAYRFTEVQVKSIFKQLLDALKYMHDNKYVHRDIKSSNILIDHHFRLKLADFGLARCIEPPILDRIHDRGNSQEFTNKVITLWYRPPELLLGATRYGSAVDIWSAGCILAELILGKPIFCGKKDMEQLQLIFGMMGTPTPESWEGFQDLKLVRTKEVEIGTVHKPRLREKYQHKMPASAINLLEKLLELDPNKRLTAGRALNSRYFLSEPRAPERPEDLGSIQVEGGHFHEFQTKKKRKEAKKIAEQARQNALEMGQSDREAQAEFDSCYRGIMEKVAQEGLGVGMEEKKSSESNGKQKETVTDNDEADKAKKEKRDKKRSSREQEKDRDRSDRKERDDRRNLKDREREKEKSKRRRSDSEEDKRRRRKRMEKGREQEESTKSLESTHEHERKEATPPRDIKSSEHFSVDRDLPVENEKHAADNGTNKNVKDQEKEHESKDVRDSSSRTSSRRRRDKSAEGRERKRSRKDEKRKSKSSRDRHKDRSHEKRRHNHDHHDRDSERSGRSRYDDKTLPDFVAPPYDLHGAATYYGDYRRDGDNRMMDTNDRGPGGLEMDRERNREIGRGSRGGPADRYPRDSLPPRGEPGFHAGFLEDFGHRDRGPPFRGPPGPDFPGDRRPPRMVEAMNAYGPGPGSAAFRGPAMSRPRDPDPPRYFGDTRRHDRGRSPPRTGDRGAPPGRRNMR